ncbi:hypothetical protein ACE1ET_12330 [Saccharicrinis sp. FJH62]|uniref:hypothetical protein n=1 Tax=Saccharicrinis sp. FJH62 TaxID=3344657 RepID=UPI0035D45220
MYKFILLLFILATPFAKAAKEEVPYWIGYPETEDTVLTDYYFKTEFKLKDSIESAPLKIAATGRLQFWVNNYFVIYDGDPSASVDDPHVFVTDIRKFLIEGKNALTVCLTPDSPHDFENNKLAISLKINNDILVYSNKEFECYRQKANNYATEAVGGKTYITFAFDAQKNIVGNWHQAGFEAKKFSPEKWQEPEEGKIFNEKDISTTYIPKPISRTYDVTNISFPQTVKPGDKVTVEFPAEKKLMLEAGFESVKDKTVYIYTPQMAQTGIKYSYKTTFGGQSFFFPVLMETDKLIFEFNAPMKFIGVTYRIMNE